MQDATYDRISDFYLNFVQRGLENEASIFHLSINAIVELVGSLSGKRVCDLACGEGYLSRILAEQGAVVTGVDISSKLLEHARQRTRNQAVTYIQDDAQILAELKDQSYDAVICNMALMDIADIGSAFQAVHRILKSDGCFVFAILHPCFEAPFRAPEDPIEIDEAGNFVAVRVMHYLQERYWNSGGDGMRGRVGAYHRTLSTYLNTLLDNGFQLARLIEPNLRSDVAGIDKKRDNRVPSLLVVKAVLQG